MKRKQLALAVALALGAGIAQAATTVNSLTSTYPVFLWEDDDIELMYQDDNGDGLLGVGDTLRGIIEITAFYDTSTGGAGVKIADMDGTDANHLSAVFETEVKSISTTISITGGVTTISYNYSFGVVGGTTGTIATFYEDPTDNLVLFDCGGSVATCEGTVTDGTKILELGFAGDVDEFWYAENVKSQDPNVGILESQTLSFNFGVFNAGLSVLFSTIGDYEEARSTLGLEPGAADGNDLVQWTIGGTVKGTCTEDATADANVTCEEHIGSYLNDAGGLMYTATSDADLEARRAVPEPGSLALLGLGLLGLGAAKLRRRS